MMQHIEGILNVGSVKSLCELTGAIVPVIKHDMKHLEHLCFFCYDKSLSYAAKNANEKMPFISTIVEINGKMRKLAHSKTELFAIVVILFFFFVYNG